MKYRALSVVSPAGSNIASGLKTVEVRKWQPSALPLKDLVIVQNEIKLGSQGVREDPNGIALALVDVITCSRWTEDLFDAACATYWEEGWLAWHLENVRPLNRKLTLPARLRIYDVEIHNLA